MKNQKITGIGPGILLIIIVIAFVYFVNFATNSPTDESDANYDMLISYMEPENVENTLNILSQCGISNFSLTRDDSLDGLDGENTLGFRVKSYAYNAIIYLKDGQLKTVRYADKDLYENGQVLNNIYNLI